MSLWNIDKIEYVGSAQGPKEGLAFHYYDADRVVAGKKMKDWLRFAVAWWHTFDQTLVDPFGKICQGHKQNFFDKFISSLFLS